MGRRLGLSKVDRKVVSALTSLRHTPWSPPSPAGYSDEVAEWATPTACCAALTLPGC